MKPLVVSALLALAVVSSAQNPGGQRNRGGEGAPPAAAPATAGTAKPIVIEPVQTKHTITVNGHPLAYTANAGTLPIRNDEGEIEGYLFFVAYTKDGADLGTRPITFAYNGGPGSSSAWLHMGVFGPRRVALNDDGSMPKPPYKLVDNQETWLESTDVVMVDAMGTGFSRPASADLARKFYGMQGDIQAYGEFVRAYLNKYSRNRSPVYLAGESYGGIRTAGLSGYLTERGIGLSGAIIISGVENFITLRNGRGNDVPFVGYLPSFTATAWYHKKLSARLQKDLQATLAEAEKFAANEYTVALTAGTSLTPVEKAKAAKRLAELTGLSETFVSRANLKITPGAFFKELLRDEGKVTGRLDSRITGQDANDNGAGAEFDPSDAAITPPYNMLVNEYLATELGVRVDERYRLTNYGTGWDYGQGGQGYPDTSEQLRQALQKNGHMKVLFACGYYDLACPYFAQKFTVNHMDLRPDQASRLSFTYYPAGHMVYIEKGSREKLKRDIDAFYEGNK
jgi:carboxypeptidase C (cathepsin A)